MRHGRLSYPIPAGFLYPAAFLSGATALLYEIVWARRLALLLGSGTAAATAVLSSFMLGLAAGAVLVGARSDTSRRPLRWYGLLELGIGVYALAFDPLLELGAGAFARQPWLCSFALLLLPAALMGGTLPVLARAGADSRERGTRVFGHLYGVNTLGAVAGALLTTFLTLRAFGLTGSIAVAAGVNIALGVVFWVLGTRAGDRQVYQEETEVAGGRWTGDAGRAVLLAFFLAGFAGLALEVAWFRLLVYFLEGFTFAFGLMLAAYLLGLGAGALGGTLLAQRSANPRRLLAQIMLVEAVLAMATFLLAQPIGDALESMRAGYRTADTIDFSYGFGLFLAALAIVLPATFCSGMLMPVVARISFSDREAIARHSGAIYAATTFGAVLAPPIAGFWLLPALTVPGAIATMAALLLLAGTLLAVTRGLREWVFAGAAAVVFVGTCLAAGLGTPVVVHSHVLRGTATPRRLLAFREGQLGGVSVVEELAGGARRLYIDGFSAAETGRHYGYMKMLGHLPVLLHPDPKAVCVVAFGTGTTAGAVAAHPEVERLVCVEIEPAVYGMAPWFSGKNRDVLDDARTERIVADGREYLRRATGRFDVVTLEPLMPYTPAAVYLYTREFYEDARRSLAPGGLLCQWIPPQGVSNADLRRLVASMTAVFDHVSLWYFRHAVLVLGGDAPPAIDLGAVEARCATPAVQADLIEATVGDAAHMLGAHVCSGAALVEVLGGASPFVDDRTDLEFRPLPRGLGKRSRAYHTENLEYLSRHHQASVKWLAGAKIEAALRTGGAVLSTLALEWRRRLEGGEIVPSTALRDHVADRGALFAIAISQRRAYDEAIAQKRYSEAALLEYAPDRSLAYFRLAQAAAQPGERLYYLRLAVRENALLWTVPVEERAAAEQAMGELAEIAKGAERRFLLNRLRALHNEPLEDGDEAPPAVALPDLRGLLAEGKIDRARDVLDRARHAGIFAQVDAQAWEWFEAASESREALRTLHAIGSEKVLRAALRVAARKTTEDLIAVAPVFCSRSRAKWEALAHDGNARVREAAAEAAKGTGRRELLGALADLCGDDVESVRLSAYISFRDIEPRADGAGYDYRAPTPEAVAALAALAGR